MQPASPFYKTFAIECSRAQVSVDMFLFSAAYQDVATLGEISFTVHEGLLLTHFDQRVCRITPLARRTSILRSMRRALRTQ